MKCKVLAVLITCMGTMTLPMAVMADPVRVQEQAVNPGRAPTVSDLSKARTAPARPAQPRPVAPPITSTKAVLDSVGKLDLSVSSNAYSSQMAKRFDAMDLNKNGVLAWFGQKVSIDPDPSAPEPLQPMFDQCFIVTYTHMPASKVKDPAKPGAWIETPATTAVADWKTWREALAKTHATNHEECAEYSTQKHEVCKLPNGSEIPPSCFLLDLNVCRCPKGASRQTKDVQVCSTWTPLGQGTTKADFLKLVSDQLKAEDWNKNGLIDAGEGQYLCPVFGPN